RARVAPVVVGSGAVLGAWADRLGLPADGLAVEDVGERDYTIAPGRTTAEGGAMAMAAVARGCDLCLGGDADALVTAPISKEAIQMAGYAFPGHTEFLAERTGAERFAMMLVSGGLRVALVTIH